MDVPAENAVLVTVIPIGASCMTTVGARHPREHRSGMASAHIRIDRNSRCLNYSPHNKNPGFCLQYISGDVERNGQSRVVEV
jgi:hypothetical protein